MNKKACIDGDDFIKLFVFAVFFVLGLFLIFKPTLDNHTIYVYQNQTVEYYELNQSYVQLHNNFLQCHNKTVELESQKIVKIDYGWPLIIFQVFLLIVCLVCYYLNVHRFALNLQKEISDFENEKNEFYRYQQEWIEEVKRK